MKYCLLSYSFYPNQVGNFVAASRNSDFLGYLPSGSQGRKRDDLCSVLGRSRAFASPYLSSRFRSHVYFASSVSTQVLQFISVDFFQFFRSLLIQVFFFRTWNITLDRRACAPSPAFLFYGYERFPLPKPFFNGFSFIASSLRILLRNRRTRNNTCSSLIMISSMSSNLDLKRWCQNICSLRRRLSPCACA